MAKPKRKPEAERFANELRMVLKFNNIRQADIADAIGLKQQYISNYCNGFAIPDKEKYNKILDFLRPVIPQNSLRSLSVAWSSIFEIDDGREREDSPLLDLFMDKFSKLNPEQKLIVLNLIQKFDQENQLK